MALGFPDLVDVAPERQMTPVERALRDHIAQPLQALLSEVSSLRATHLPDDLIRRDLEVLEDSVRRVLRHARTAPAPAEDLEPRSKRDALSIRELNVLRQVAAGLSNKQIARTLGISEKTVRNHLTRVFSKLGATNRTEAVISAIRTGLVTA